MFQGNEHHWLDADTMEQQIDSMVENAVSAHVLELLPVYSPSGERDWRVPLSRFNESCPQLVVLRVRGPRHRAYTLSFCAIQVERALADRGSQALGLVDRGAEESENAAKLDEMKEEMDVSRSCIFVVGSTPIALHRE